MWKAGKKSNNDQHLLKRSELRNISGAEQLKLRRNNLFRLNSCSFQKWERPLHLHVFLIIMKDILICSYMILKDFRISYDKLKLVFHKIEHVYNVVVCPNQNDMRSRP